MSRSQTITKIIAKAKTGDKLSRDKLINHYSYVVENIALNYDYMEYEDLVQFGMIKLIEIIDHQLLVGDGSLFTPRLIKYIKQYYDITLRNKAKLCNITSAIGERNNHIDFYEKLAEIELEDLINSQNMDIKDKLYAIKYFVKKYSLNQIGAIYDCSKQAVSVRVNKVAQKIKSEYIK